MIVADTNLISYLLILSESTPAAQAVLEKDPLWHAPLLWRSEFRSVLTMYLRQGHLKVGEAVAYMDEAESLLEGQEYQIPSAPVFQLAFDSGCSAYDCEFVHLARELEIPLVTSDRRVLRAFPGTALSMQDFADKRL